MFDNLRGRSPGLMDADRYKDYAVLAPYLSEERAFLFEVRSGALRSQPGEICFPGGRIEPGETPQDAARRETAEELLIAPGKIEVVGELDTLITPFYTRIFPYIGLLSDYHDSFSADEVAKVFRVPFDFFLEAEPTVYYNEIGVAPGGDNFPYELLGRDSYPWGRAKYPVLFYPYGDQVIWGLTARIMHHIVRLYRDGTAT